MQTTELFHGMTFQQIVHRMAGNGLLWNPVLIALMVFDAYRSGWTWISYALITYFALRFLTSAYIAAWVPKQPAARNIARQTKGA